MTLSVAEEQETKQVNFEQSLISHFSSQNIHLSLDEYQLSNSEWMKGKPVENYFNSGFSIESWMNGSSKEEEGKGAAGCILLNSVVSQTGNTLIWISFQHALNNCRPNLQIHRHGAKAISLPKCTRSSRERMAVVMSEKAFKIEPPKTDFSLLCYWLISR